MRLSPGRAPLLVPAVAAVALAAVAAAPLLTRFDVLALLVGPGLLVVALLFRRPWLGVLALVFSVPFEDLRGLSASMPSLTVSKLLGVLLLAFAAVHVLFGERGPRHIRANIWIWLLPFLVVNVISALYSPYPDTAFDALRQFLIAALVTALCLLYLEDERHIRRLTDAVIAAVTISSLVGVAGAFGHAEVGMEGGRVTGAASDPNVFAAFVVFALPLVIYRLLDAPAAWVRPLLFVALAINLTAVMMTFSRGGSLVMAATLVMVGWHYRSRITPRRVGLVLVAGMMMAAAGLFVVPGSYWERLGTLFEERQDRSLGRRSAYIEVGLEAVQSAPLFGHGPGTFRELFGQSDEALRFQTSWNPDTKRYAHNTYLEVVVGTGVLGLALFLGLLAQSWGNFRRAQDMWRRRGESALADLAAAWRFSFTGLAIYFLILSQWQAKFLWTAVAVSVVLTRAARPRKD